MAGLQTTVTRGAGRHEIMIVTPPGNFLMTVVPRGIRDSVGFVSIPSTGTGTDRNRLNRLEAQGEVCQASSTPPPIIDLRIHGL